MGPFTAFLVAFGFTFGGALLGMYLRKILPQHYQSAETKDGVKETFVLVVTMSALILGLLVASAKTYFDSEVNASIQLAANFITLDRTFANYGPETKDARAQLREVVLNTLSRMFPEKDVQALQSGVNERPAEALIKKVHELDPKGDEQRVLKSQALTLLSNIASTRWMMFLHRTTSTPLVLVFIVIFWLTVIFIRFGMFYPSNAIQLASLFVASLSVSFAVLLIMRLYSPYGGILRVPLGPLQVALKQIGQ